MNLKAAFSANGTAETFLAKRGLWILLAFTLGYYGYYVNVWPGPGGEGGVAALLSQRLLQGQRPIVDTFLGYNVLWFYPIVGIFKLMGPHYLAMRTFFFVLCTLTGFLAYGIVWKSTGKAWAALLTGVLVILVPGQTYRNYMAFMAVLNMSVFLSALVLPSKTLPRRLLWMFLSGVSLGIAYLIRVDVGFFLSFILLGLFLLYAIGDPDGLRPGRRLLATLAGLLLATSALFLTHLPIYLDAQQRGFAPEFTGQYRQWPCIIRDNGFRMLAGAWTMIHDALPRAVSKPASTTASTPGQTAVPASVAMGPSVTAATRSSAKELKITHGAQQRVPITAGKLRDKIMSLNLYLPIPVSLLLLVIASAAWLSAMGAGDRERATKALSSLTALGCALTLFPQYFFWQPNMVHLSEFMVPMTIALVISSLMAADILKHPGLRRIPNVVYLFSAILALVLYYVNGCQSGGGGGIAVSLHKRFPFHAANGTDVIMNAEEFELNSAMRDIITAVSDPGEFVICYPYQPEVNFYSDRPSYERNVYADNDIPGDNFYSDLLANVSSHHPVVFVLDNWDINGTEESRFYNWAWKAYRHITENYRLAYRHGDFEVYVRPDREDRIPEKFRASASSSPTP